MFDGSGSDKVWTPNKNFELLAETYKIAQEKHTRLVYRSKRILSQEWSPEAVGSSSIKEEHTKGSKL